MIDDLARLTPDLATLGWTEKLDEWSGEVSDPDKQVAKGRIAQVSRGFSLVFTGGEAVLAASGSLRTDTGIAPATGDFVVIEQDPEDGPSLAAIAERSTTLSRRAPGRVPEPQILAANMDGVFVMESLEREINLRRVERQLVVAWDSGATPSVVLTKADQADRAEGSNGRSVAERVAEVHQVAPGVATFAISTVTGEGMDLVRERVGPGHTVVLMGLSGIGKSTLVNEITGGEVQRTGEVRATDRRGRHTTVTRDMIPIPGGGFIIDTPGIREIGLWRSYEGLDLTFPEIAEQVTRCRFADCEHLNEPDCAVRAGLTEGVIPERRLDHWRDLQAELALQETQLEEFTKRSESRDRAEAERKRDAERPNTRSRNRSNRRRKRRR